MGEATIKISPNGQKVEVDAQGFTGGGCLTFLQDTLNALGSKVDRMETKPEYHDVKVETVNIGG